MQKKQIIYAAILGVLSLTMLVAWTIQAINLADGTYTNPLTDGWLLTAFLAVSPFATGFAVAMEKPMHPLISVLRMIVLSQIPIFALTLCASTVSESVEAGFQIATAIWMILAAVSGVAMAIHAILVNRD